MNNVDAVSASLGLAIGASVLAAAIYVSLQAGQTGWEATFAVIVGWIAFAFGALIILGLYMKGRDDG